jgi:hypothetical protein
MNRLLDIEAVADQLINDGWKEGQDQPRPIGITYRELTAEIRRLMDIIESAEAQIRNDHDSLESAENEIGLLKEELDSYKPQPIETAPTDGKAIVVFEGVGKEGQIAWIDKTKEAPTWVGSRGITLSFTPTHWMPIPVLEEDDGEQCQK